VKQVARAVADEARNRGADGAKTSSRSGGKWQRGKSSQSSNRQREEQGKHWSQPAADRACMVRREEAKWEAKGEVLHEENGGWRGRPSTFLQMQHESGWSSTRS
jgi:hypothetical protein